MLRADGLLGVVIQPGPQTRGSAVRVWGVGQPIPGAGAGDWAPSHPVLDSYRAGIYSDCRGLSTRRFVVKEVGLVAAAIWTFFTRVVTFSWFRACRFLYVYIVELSLLFSAIAVPAIAAYMYHSLA